MGRSVVVTGANSGIGLATALELAATGYDVVGTVRSAAKAEVLTRAAVDRGLLVRTVEMDVDDAASCADGVARIGSMTGDLWGLVNNAGYAQFGAVEDVPDDLVRRQLETNVIAPIRLARLVLPGMRARGRGRIVNISSVVGRLSTPLVGWYSASKHALEAVTDALRMEVEGDGVRVVLVAPGMFGTGIWGPMSQGGLPEPTSPRYATAYARIDAVGRRSDALPDPVRVARTVGLALGSQVPVARYTVGVDAIAGMLAERLLPTTLTDYVKAVAVGLRSVPLTKPFRG